LKTLFHWVIFQIEVDDDDGDKFNFLFSGGDISPLKPKKLAWLNISLNS